MSRELLIGITGNAVVNTDKDTFDVDTRFRLAKESGFDYFDKTPPTGELEIYQRASEKHALPIRCGGFYYTRNRDEDLLAWHMRMARELGTVLQNIQIKPKDADGKFLSDQDIAEVYLYAYELGQRFNIIPSFEVHINMWSEHFGRVSKVGEIVEKQGAKFNITLDHSHVIFKIDNPKEQEVLGMKEDVDAGRVILDPFKPGNVASEWIERNYVTHSHARPAIPANPVNIWAKHPDGSFGRGVQYPFIQPGEGEWHSSWSEENLEPWKEVVRQLLRHHASNTKSCLGQISMEIIPAPDYGGGGKYSLLANNIACADWIRKEWASLQTTNTFTH